MPRTRKDEAPVALDHPVIEGRYVELEDYTVSFESFHLDADAAPLFVGLPGDRCQCPHWGVVVSGAVTVRYADAEETFRAGDAYFMPPGHVNEVTAGTELVEFSPTVELQKTMAVMGENMAKAEAAS